MLSIVLFIIIGTAFIVGYDLNQEDSSHKNENGEITTGGNLYQTPYSQVNRSIWEQRSTVVEE